MVNKHTNTTRWTQTERERETHTHKESPSYEKQMVKKNKHKDSWLPNRKRRSACLLPPSLSLRWKPRSYLFTGKNSSVGTNCLNEAMCLLKEELLNDTLNWIHGLLPSGGWGGSSQDHNRKKIIDRTIDVPNNRTRWCYQTTCSLKNCKTPENNRKCKEYFLSRITFLFYHFHRLKGLP